ncbi:fatty acyl-AMP ligase [Nocardia pseudobrasiliensis]|uniref:Acyl-CoA synthetase (AMP-forming)/AMP-acid ligase II n=1 Tax=Nocardia pseudobrasiliensis TaxID=45979 RepID=A0A370IFF0_9NOCA|nr:fatty acyl-AMP ligase [Nocardia pseudobrasiliensis]RDI68871.1 acyl-CoA synthetase (AMP-forming)/AMP-acid ligase II [Nocardia pseudobrasiliensis]
MTATIPTAPAVRYDTMVRALRAQAEIRPDAVAYNFLHYPDTQDPHGVKEPITFAEIDRYARAFAVSVLQLAQPGERAVLLLPPGLDYVKAFFGCLYAGIVAVPLFPPSMHNANGRLDAVCTDADPACLITTDDEMARVTAWLDESPIETTRLVLSTGEVDQALADKWEYPAIDAEHTALLQYTSGSTRTPAGVMVPHRGLLANAHQIYDVYARTGLDVEGDDMAFVSWLPLFHDMGLMVGVVMPVINGHQVIQLSASAFLRRPERWLQAISDVPQQTFSASPNLGYELCTQRIDTEQRARLDLSRWRYGLAGAEPVRVSTMRRFNELFGPQGLREKTLCAGFGLAEATLIVSAPWRTGGGVQTITVDRDQLANGVAVPVEGEGAEIVGAGWAVPGVEMLIVDPATREPLPEHGLGEVWVDSPALASGYFNRPEETEQTFRAELATGDGRYYMRTGDIGFLHDGELYLTSRLKDLIIVDGRNFYPPDLEATAEQAHPLVLPSRCSIFSIDDNDREKIVVLVEARLNLNSDEGAATAAELRNSVRQAIFDVHEVGVHDVALVAPGAIPRTSSGKIQRSASRKAYLDGSLRVLRAR